jgi:hypothetical protein
MEVVSFYPPQWKARIAAGGHDVAKSLGRPTNDKRNQVRMRKPNSRGIERPAGVAAVVRRGAGANLGGFADYASIASMTDATGESGKRVSARASSRRMERDGVELVALLDSVGQHAQARAPWRRRQLRPPSLHTRGSPKHRMGRDTPPGKNAVQMTTWDASRCSSRSWRPWRPGASFSAFGMSGDRRYPAAVSVGMRKWKVLPAPGSLSRSMVPRWASTMPLAMKSPRPAPWRAVSGACQ